jgi:hypothetical protein
LPEGRGVALHEGREHLHQDGSAEPSRPAGAVG